MYSGDLKPSIDARAQCSPVVGTGTPVIPGTVGHAYSALLSPHDLLPSDEATEASDKGLPRQIQSPAYARGQTELPWGKAKQHVMWHNGQLQTCGPEGKKPLTEAHGCLPDLNS